MCACVFKRLVYPMVLSNSSARLKEASFFLNSESLASIRMCVWRGKESRGWTLKCMHRCSRMYEQIEKSRRELSDQAARNCVFCAMRFSFPSIQKFSKNFTKIAHDSTLFPSAGGLSLSFSKIEGLRRVSTRAQREGAKQGEYRMHEGARV